MDDQDLLQLAEFVLAEYGLNFLKKLRSLEIKTKRRLSELSCSYADYCKLVKTDTDERERLVELLTVHETYFFREDNQLRELCDVVLPVLQSGMRAAPIRIWSAACSTGEEPYSIAMMMYEKLGRAAQHVRILATDIDQKTLGAATEALYSNKSFTFRRMPNEYLTRYFDFEEDVQAFRVKRKIRQMVEFRRLNLFDGRAIAQLGEMDVIFCRNVLIYFDDAGKERVIRSLYEQLRPNGYLFMGHAESIQRPGVFQTIRSPGTFYYQKEEGKSWVPTGF